MAGFLSASWIAPYGRGQSFINRPAIRVDSLREGLSVHSKSLGPIAQRHCDSVERKRSGRRFVPALFSVRFPFNVPWLVAKVVIDTTDRVSVCWGRSNIKQKILKALPSFADRNASAAIFGVSLHRWVLASANHCIPSAPFFGSLPANRVPMSCHDIPLKSVMRSHYTAPLGFGHGGYFGSR
jgi:hypothetical protein